MVMEAPRLTEWLVREPPEPKWLLENFLPEQSLAMCSGPRKVAHKTWFAIEAALAVAIGKTLEKPMVKAEHDGKRVLFIEEEGTGHDTRSRFFKLLKSHGIDPRTGQGQEAMEKLDKNFLFMHHPRVKLDNPNWVAILRNFVKENEVKLIVLDAITYMTSGDENKKQDMAPVNDALFAFRQLGASVLYLVHTNKAAQREDADPDLDVRGSSVLLDAYDVHFALRRNAKEYINLLARYRDFEEQRFRVTWTFQPDSVSGLVKPVTEELEEADALKDYIAHLIPGVEYTIVGVAKTFGLEKKEAAKLLNSLTKVGALVPAPNGTFHRSPS